MAMKKATNTLTEEQVIDLIKTTQGELSLRDYALKIGVSPSYISDIYLGRRNPGNKVLKHFKIRKVRKVSYDYVR